MLGGQAMQLEVGQTYKVCVEIVKSDERAKPKMKFVPAILTKIYPHFYLFDTKNYQTTIHKADHKLIREDKTNGKIQKNY